MGFKYRIDCHSQSTVYIDRDNIHDAYFNDVRRFPLLSEQEEKELLDKVRNGSTQDERDKSKNRLIECNLRFVISIAKKLGTRETFLDLVSEGNIGLIEAIDRFDTSTNCRLITYAVSWIIAYIQRYQIKQLKPVVPPNALKLHNFVRCVTKDFFEKNERNPTADEIAEMVKEKFNFNITNLEDVELGRVISIDEKYSVIDDDDTFEESSTYITKTSSNNIQEDIENEYKKHTLDFFLGKLTDREKFIVERRYGIGCEREGLDTIGLRLGLCEERVRQICLGAVKKMQKYKQMIRE